jgi:hypothetical protein
MKLTIHIRNGALGVQAYCPDLPGCSASGRTEDEALAQLRQRITAYFKPEQRRPAGTRVIHIEV